ncbi:MAG: glycosyltransferase family 39 protein [Candidatus Bathyarchaeia archaeon]
MVRSRWISLLATGVFIGVFTYAYSLSTNTVLDERIYSTEAFELYSKGLFPLVYPLLPALTALSLVVLGLQKHAFIIVPFFSTVIAIWFTYDLSLRLSGDRNRAAISVFLLASNPVIIWLSTRHMTDTLFTLLTLLVFWSLLRKNLTARYAFLGGVFSILAYLARYPGLVIFPFITVALALTSRSKRVTAAYLASLVLLIPYWLVNFYLFGGFFPTESYSLSFVQPRLEVPVSLILEVGGKILVGLGPIFLNTVLFIPPFLIMAVRGRGRGRFSNATEHTTGFLRHAWLLIFVYVVYFSVFQAGYFTLVSFTWGFSVSADHLTRWIGGAVMPLIVLLVRPPSRHKKLNLLLILVSVIVGIAVGYYLTNYNNLYSHIPVSWDDFLREPKAAW